MWINKETAKELGMTHEGTLYGVDVWMQLGNTQEFHAVAKFIPLAIWLWICEVFYDAAVYFMREDQYLETPMTIGVEL